MSIAERTAPNQTEALEFEMDLAHPPAKAWRALTEPDLLAQWLLPSAGLELSPGAEFMLKTDPQPGWDGTVNCRVLEVEVGRKLSYAWVVGDLDTVVTFELTPSEAGTLLRIVQSGFQEGQKQNFGGARYGWRMMTGKLEELLGNMA